MIRRSAVAANIGGVSSDSALSATPSPPPHQSALRKGRISLPNHCYFITAAISDCEPLLANPQLAEIIIDSLVWLQEQGRIRLMGFVIMPDHIHTAFALPSVGAPFRARPVAQPSLSRVMNSFKGYTGKKINELLNRHQPLWQPSYHDHLVRDRKDFETRLSYMHGNPVRKDLVHYEHEYSFSTANPKYAHLIDWEWLDGINRARKGAPTDTVIA